MSSSVDKTSGETNSLFSVQNILIAGVAWGVLALLYFLLFSIATPGEERPAWYVIGTYIFELGAYLGAAILCFRNWRSPQIVSGRGVWLGFGIGMLLYFVGGLLFGYWEIILKQEPIVSPGDFFYVPAYLFLSGGMVAAVISRKLNLEIWQWGIVAGIAAAGIALAIWLSIATPANSEPAVAPAPAAAPVAKKPNPPKPAAAKAPPLKKPVTPAAPPAKAVAPVAEEKTPGWVISLEKVLEPLGPIFSIFYVACDVFLLIVATTVLLAFWGGRFSLSWRMIAGAAFSYYIADMWLKYADTFIGDEYQSGGLLEVFWVFSGVLFAIGAVLEFDTSSRSRQRGRRRA